MRRRPPAISLTRLTYSSAISLKMSLAPHAPCILSTIGDCDFAIIGKPAIAAPPAAAAPVRNFRRAGLTLPVCTATGCSMVLLTSLLI